MKKLKVLKGEERARWSRREFLRVAGLAAAAFAGHGLVGCGGDGGETFGPDLPSLGGAPDDYDGRTIAAFCDTVIPGAWRDPEKKPGAIDVGAPALFFDPELPAAALVQALVVLLDQAGRREFDAPFALLTPDQRDVALETQLAITDILEFAVQLAKLAFFSSEGAGEYLGYPGANAGYVGDPDFSFGLAMADELTTDGNLP